MRNILRQYFETQAASIAPGDTVFFLGSVLTPFGYDATSLPEGSLEITVYPVTRKGPNLVGAVSRTITWKNRCKRPLPPILRSASVGGGVANLTIEQVRTVQGLVPLEQMLYSPPHSIVHSFIVEQWNDYASVRAGVALAGTAIPADPDAAPFETGVFVAAPLTIVDGATKLRIYSEFDGYRSADYLEVQL